MEKRVALSEGYYYIVYGPSRYEVEAICSIESLRSVHPEAPVGILMDREPSSQLRALVNNVEVDPTLHPKTPAEGLVDDKFEGRLYNLHRSPYSRTFILDTDTYFYENCHHLFDLLQWFDVAVCQAEGERSVFWPHKPHHRMGGFSSWTNGVMLYRRGGAFLRVMQKSARYYQQNRRLYNYKGTNVHFSAAIAEDPELRVYTLPINYNARVRGKLALTGTVKIAHSSSGKTKMKKSHYEAVRAVINKSDGYRMWDPRTQECR